MLKLKQSNSVPPGGYTFTIKQTGYTASGNTLAELVGIVSRHLEVNKLVPALEPGVSLADIIEHDICSRIPSSLSYDSKRPGFVAFSTKEAQVVSSVMPQLGNTVISRTVSLLSMARQYEFVSSEIAEERAARAVVCPYAVRDRACYVCSHQSVVHQNAGRKFATTHDSMLCTDGKLIVYLRPAVFIDLRVFLQIFTEATFKELNEGYWLYPELKSYFNP